MIQSVKTGIINPAVRIEKIKTVRLRRNVDMNKVTVLKYNGRTGNLSYRYRINGNSAVEDRLVKSKGIL